MYQSSSKDQPAMEIYQNISFHHRGSLQKATQSTKNIKRRTMKNAAASPSSYLNMAGRKRKVDLTRAAVLAANQKQVGAAVRVPTERPTKRRRRRSAKQVRFAPMVTAISLQECNEVDKNQLYYSNQDIARFVSQERKRQQLGYLTATLCRQQMLRLVNGRGSSIIPSFKTVLLYHKVCNTDFESNQATLNSSPYVHKMVASQAA